jgi:hypothetical protein
MLGVLEMGETPKLIQAEPVVGYCEGMEPEPVKGRVVAIVGFAETTRMQVLKEPESTEIWSLNRCYVFLKRWDRWYEVHEPDLYTGKTGLREEGYLDLLRNSKVPIYMQHPSPEFPMAQKLPKDEIIHMFGQQGEGFDYFTTSIAYMLAHVAYEHKMGQSVSEMHMYGVDMSAYSEYSEQLPCVNFWLGVLMGMGIKVVIPTASPLLKCVAQYGRHGERPMWKMCKERIQHHKEKQAQLQADVSSLVGRNDEYPQFVFPAIDKLIEELHKGEIELDALLAEFKQHFKNRRQEIGQVHANQIAELNSTLGGLREAQHWLVAFNAPQTVNEEPESAKLPSQK